MEQLPQAASLGSHAMPPLRPMYFPTLVSLQLEAAGSAGGYNQRVAASTDNLEHSQQMRSPHSSHLLCSCIPFIAAGIWGRSILPTSPLEKKEMPHSSLSTRRCSASAKGARTEASYLPSMEVGGAV